MITDKEINKAFENTKFGENPNHRKIIVDTLLKLSIGFGVGRTAAIICLELGLLTGRMKPSKKGILFMREHYDLMTNNKS